MTLMEHTEAITSRNSGTITAIMLLIQLLIVPGLGWMFVKIDDIQNSAANARQASAVFSDRQKRQSADILDIKNTLKGVETIEAAEKARKKIWATDQDQYQRLNTLRDRLDDTDSRVQRLETLTGQ